MISTSFTTDRRYFMPFFGGLAEQYRPIVTNPIFKTHLARKPVNTGIYKHRIA
jgi:hypothetical protein